MNWQCIILISEVTSVRNDYIFGQVNKIIDKYCTRDPFELLDAMGVIMVFSRKYSADGLKGYCLLANRTTYVVINDFLWEEEQRIVAMHELGHIILHRHILQVAPMRDFELYGMKNRAEYEANLFAADTLISDQVVEELAKNEYMDYFCMCKTLGISPELMSFKLYSLIHRGHNYKLPQDIKSGFLKS